MRRPVAAGVVAYVHGLRLKMLVKDRLTRPGWWAEKRDHLGTGVTGRVFGVIGFGNIGCEIFTLAKPFGMRHLAYDPHLTPAQAAEARVELVDLDTLLQTSDVISINGAASRDTPPDQRQSAGADETDGVPDQHRAGRSSISGP